MFDAVQQAIVKGVFQMVLMFLFSKFLFDGVLILWHNVTTRYDPYCKFKLADQLKLAFGDYITESKGAIAFFVLSCGLQLAMIQSSGVSIRPASWFVWFLVALTIHLYKKWCPPTFDDLPVRIYLENDRFNVGHTLAHAYVINYLMIVLGKAGLIEKIKAFEFKENAPQFSFSSGAPSVVGTDSIPFTNVKVAFKKLLILIPSSGVKRHRLLSEAGDPGIVLHGNLTATVLDKDGKQEREFVNTIYKLKRKINDEEIYFVGEFATPVCTLSDMQGNAVLSSAQATEQTRHFLAALLNLLEKNKMALTDSCLPIYYDDCYDGAMSEAIIKEVCKVNLAPVAV